MPRFHDDVLDAALAVIVDDADELHICSQEPTTFEEASDTYSLGDKQDPTISAPLDGLVSGRRVVISAITDGSVAETGDATHWALVDSAGERLLAAGPLDDTMPVTASNIFTMTEFSVGIKDPVAE